MSSARVTYGYFEKAPPHVLKNALFAPIAFSAKKCPHDLLETRAPSHSCDCYDMGWRAFLFRVAPTHECGVWGGVKHGERFSLTVVFDVLAWYDDRKNRVRFAQTIFGLWTTLVYDWRGESGDLSLTSWMDPLKLFHGRHGHRNSPPTSTGTGSGLNNSLVGPMPTLGGSANTSKASMLPPNLVMK